MEQGTQLLSVCRQNELFPLSCLEPVWIRHCGAALIVMVSCPGSRGPGGSGSHCGSRCHVHLRPMRQQRRISNGQLQGIRLSLSDPPVHTPLLPGPFRLSSARSASGRLPQPMMIPWRSIRAACGAVTATRNARNKGVCTLRPPIECRISYPITRQIRPLCRA